MREMENAEIEKKLYRELIQTTLNEDVKMWPRHMLMDNEKANIQISATTI